LWCWHNVIKSEKVFCLNTNLIHGVINESKDDRVILSISFKDDYDKLESFIKQHVGKGNGKEILYG
jgi:hypothetical protein